MTDKIFNKWLPISQFPYNEDDSPSVQGKPNTWAPNEILLYGVGDSFKCQPFPFIWTLNSLYIDDKDRLRFSSETWYSGSWIEVIPTMYMEVTPPSEQEIEYAASS